MEAMKLDAIDLIKSYIETSRSFVEKAQRKFGQYDLLRGWRSGAIPQEGILIDGETFRFHGVGCEFTSSVVTIDIDFGPDGRCDGFDAIHLWRFSREGFPSTENWTIEKVSAELERLKATGEVICPGWNPTPHFCYLIDRRDDV